MKADVIMVLEDGKVEEIGSHAELVKKDGIYRRIYDLQSGYTSGKDNLQKTVRPINEMEKPHNDERNEAFDEGGASL
jgi:hypothetical protein